MAGAADLGLLLTKSAARCSRRESQLCVKAGTQRLLVNMSRLLIHVLLVGSLGGDKIETTIYSVATEKLHRQLDPGAPRSPTSARFTASHPSSAGSNSATYDRRLPQLSHDATTIIIRMPGNTPNCRYPVVIRPIAAPTARRTRLGWRT
jgi:hypothetical protein